MHALTVSLVCCDLPLTVIGDTITLPYILTAQLSRYLKGNSTQCNHTESFASQ